MSYDPRNPQHPLDKWWERNKRRFVLLPFVAAIGFMAFFAQLLKIVIFDELMPTWGVISGSLCLFVLILTFAEMMQGYFRDD